ncbi:MAG: magnesium-translocating P-type ATPase, partial [Planctomycetia bacterium]|nr:magnesium-translocating P-type ATPase [Planctomycetia bacterium]
LVATMTPTVFLLNGLARGDWWEAFLFAVAVAVGLTPEMLPMVVGTCLAQGAIRMARRRVIVKHLDSIQNLGAMDLLCTDKTGTLTLDRIILERHCDVTLTENDEVLRLAWLNSRFQTGLANLLDRAILDHERLRGREPGAGCSKIDEIPFDFSRRAMSVVVEEPGGGRRLVCKGAPDSIFARCAAFALDGAEHPFVGDVRARLVGECDRLGRDGFRVLAVATRVVPPRAAYSRDDERDLVLQGYVAFLDPPKDSAREALAALVAGGVRVKVLTGDEESVSRTVCRAVGLDAEAVLHGDEIDRLDDDALAVAAGRATLLVRLTPGHKERVVRLLRRAGHVVGFLGDGVNDAPALRAADVGVTVDAAVDVAKESADCVLLDKDLRVLAAGMDEGRRVFANVVKELRMGASSNFGNMLSVLAASVFLPAVPMTPLQILANNLLYDLAQVPIPTDHVDPEQVARPRPWAVREIATFILLLGPVSSLFDWITFAILLGPFGCTDPARAPLLHTGWFVESLLTQTFIIHVIRTNRIPFLGSRASTPLVATTVVVMLVGAWLPGSALGPTLGFVPVPTALWPIVAAILLGYALTTFLVKRWLVRRGWLT